MRWKTSWPSWPLKIACSKKTWRRMGRTANEISRRREARDHPDRWGVHLAGAADAGKPGIPRATFYRWYDLCQTGGPEALADRRPKPDRVWNRTPGDVRDRIITLALDEPAVSRRELAVRFTGGGRGWGVIL
jgi:hypothetical protein